MPRLAFFLGKGGVGKTTVSSAYAIHCARRSASERVLLLSTDPAHSLADVLQTRLNMRICPVVLTRGQQLYVWQVDAATLFRKFLAKSRDQILSIIDAGAIFSREDIEPLLDNALPGMAEVSALLAIHEAVQSGRYDRIVIDTAPFGHTLRLFELPRHFEAFLHFLELAASRDAVLAAHFGGRANASASEFLAEWRSLAAALHAAFGKVAELFLVTTPEKFAMNESVRIMRSLRNNSAGFALGNIVLNRAIAGQTSCRTFNCSKKATLNAKRLLAREFPGSDVLIAEDSGGPVLGLENLARFGQHVFGGRELRLKITSPHDRPFRLSAVSWPAATSRLSFVLGKGGVGKTTISAALAFETRKKARAPVEICSVDPAPSLDDVFMKKVSSVPEPVLGDSKLLACELDSVAMFREWVRQIRASIDEEATAKVSGIHLDLSFERQLLSALLDIVPPGVDEVLAIFRIVDLLSRPGHRVLIDMAPTGHALELLRMPERILGWTRPLLKTLAAHRTLALARDAAVKVAEVGQRARELLQVLGDPQGSLLHVVMLAEPMPDRETERLLDSLQELGLRPRSLFVNRVLFSEDVGRCRRCRRAMQWQRSTLAKIKKRNELESIYVVRNFPDEIAGKKALQSFTNELWRLA